MMKCKFRCGRLCLKNDGTVKKVELIDGGGTRDCTLNHIDTTFDEIHDRLRELFLLGPTDGRSRLHDFRCKQIDTNRYSSFLAYITEHGLKFNGTLLYLCTLPDNEQTSSSLRNSRVDQVEADSSTTTDASPSNEESALRENVRRFSPSNYSFDQSLIKLIDYLRYLATRPHHEGIFIRLSEQFCTINGLSLLNLDRMKHEFQRVTEEQKLIYNEAMEKIENSCRTVTTLIRLNTVQISHLDRQSLISKSFDQFYHCFKTLRDQWTYNHQTIQGSLNDRLRPETHNARQEQTRPLQQSTNSNSSFDRVHPSSHNVSQKRTRSPQQPNHRNSSFDSVRPESHTVSQKQASSSQLPIHTNSSMFDDLLNSFEQLSDILRNSKYSSFHRFVSSLIDEVKSSQTSIDLSDYQSLQNAKQLMISLEGRLTKRINDESDRTSSHGIIRQIEMAFDRTIQSIKHFLTLIQYHEDLINNNKRQRKSRWSSPPRQELLEHKSKTTSNQVPIVLDDDQSSETSHSSVEDAVLRETVKHACKRKSNRSK